MKPIDAMLETVEWTPTKRAENPAGPMDGIPYATHSGVLEIAGAKLRCYRLNNGHTVFDADDMREFFGDFLDVQGDPHGR